MKADARPSAFSLLELPQVPEGVPQVIVRLGVVRANPQRGTIGGNHRIGSTLPF